MSRAMREHTVRRPSRPRRSRHRGGSGGRVGWRSNRPRGDDPCGRETGSDDDRGYALGNRDLRHPEPPSPTPQPHPERGDPERLTEPPPAAVQEHRHRVDRRAHLLGRLAVGQAEHVPVHHRRPLLSRQARERRAKLGLLRGLLRRVLLERFRVQAPPPEAAAGVERDRGEPGARVARDRAALEGALRIDEGRLHHVLGIVRVVQLALHEPDQPGAVLSIQPLDLGRHGLVVPQIKGSKTTPRS